MTYSMTREKIIEICNKYHISNYTIGKDSDGLYIDVDGNVQLSYRGMGYLPVRFGYVSGSFYCDNNKLTSLRGCPISVGGIFSCGDNRLSSLRGCPKIVRSSFYCANNILTSLEGCPHVLGDGKYKDFVCSNNRLTSFMGCPSSVGNFYCGYNNLLDDSYYHLFDLGYDNDNIHNYRGFDLVSLRRQWVLKSIINE
jgi:hypothetical protein